MTTPARLVLFRFLIVGVCLVSTLFSTTAMAGPPFRTDDPEPVEHKHWEVYLASQYFNFRDGSIMTAPHVEINYGAIPNLQLHLIAPMVNANPAGEKAHYGFGDTEFGAKYRFIQEGDWCPMVGTFPLLELPTGKSSEDLGNGAAQVFLPIWLQKSWEQWTTYGGGGYWINPGQGNQNNWFLGWVVQRQISKELTLGAEVYHQTPIVEGGDSATGFNLGGIISFNDTQHLLFSVGRDFSGPNRFSYYVAYQLTFGP
jgi:hypothetical protein